jgi:hypothetical protein
MTFGISFGVRQHGAALEFSIDVDIKNRSPKYMPLVRFQNSKAGLLPRTPNHGNDNQWFFEKHQWKLL